MSSNQSSKFPPVKSLTIKSLLSIKVISAFSYFSKSIAGEGTWVCEDNHWPSSSVFSFSATDRSAHHTLKVTLFALSRTVFLQCTNIWKRLIALVSMVTPALESNNLLNINVILEGGPFSWCYISDVWIVWAIWY